MSERVVYWNGAFIPETEARVSIYDSAMMFGDAVFEMTRSFAGRQFKLREHLERLHVGLRILEYPDIPAIEDLEAACHATIETNAPGFDADDEHRLMITVTRGLLGIYRDNVDLPTGPNVIIADYPLRWTVAGMGGLFDTGVNAVVPPQRAIPATYLDPKIKNRSRIHYQVANIQAARISGQNNWALLLDERGFLSEGTGANVFLVRGSEVLTPRGHDVLRGISRDYVMKELCPKLGLVARECDLEPYDVHQADEAFMTATPFCMIPVTGFEGQPVGSGRPGPVFARLMAAWSEAVGVDIIAQIKGWNRSRDLGDTPTTYAFRSGLR
ncbi:aminotransferase class IV [Polymorphum gilvum]|uniref:Probable branched-chain-amino-acid aminotransferase n=1 Tax=Polymorphum gilvum (strain LMG 25793 / CGMCC 1.9160 / SL003B-26A1) TaxID=991905 RepID=F2J5C9_POLGS|nr:aminotransferase class IV [Polymorphum gilvum]ADZ71188.1 Branched-chain amino acid aminotransferase 1 [Polymorphum gilvum SL003B-26A1]